MKQTESNHLNLRYNILAIAGLTGKQKTAIDSKHLQRPQEPLSSFNMDYTQRRIGNGETVYVFGVLDIFNSGIVILDAHETKSGENVVESLHQLRKNCTKKYCNRDSI